MTVVWSRVDSKLIHGQITAAWVPHLEAETIVIVDGDTAADPRAQKIMFLSLPPEVQFLHFAAPGDLAEFLAGEDTVARRVFLIFKNLKSVIQAAAAGLTLEKLNLGNQLDQSARATGRRLSDTFFALQKDLDALAGLHKNGLEVIVQSVPAAKPAVWKPKA